MNELLQHAAQQPTVLVFGAVLWPLCTALAVLLVTVLARLWALR